MLQKFNNWGPCPFALNPGDHKKHLTTAGLSSKEETSLLRRQEIDNLLIIYNLEIGTREIGTREIGTREIETREIGTREIVI